MKSLFKGIALTLAIAMVAFCFAGCSQGASTDTTTTTTAANDTTTTAAATLGLKTEGVLVMGTNAEFPPFEYEEGGAVVGLDADMMQAVADKLGLTLEIKNMGFDSLPSALSATEIDCIAAGLTVNPDREETMDFTDGYYTASQTIIVKKDSTVKVADDLKDLKIGVQSGTTGQFTAEEYTDAANVIGYQNGALAVEALLNDQCEAVIIDNNPAKEYGTQYSDQVTLIEGQFESETYAVSVAKGNTALRDAINGALAEMKADGTFDAIVEKYIK
ncbi:MAG: basic amino acid ABC transporter substrate-binding protein [Acutalibacteraceae bacterium]